MPVSPEIKTTSQTIPQISEIKQPTIKGRTLSATISRSAADGFFAGLSDITHEAFLIIGLSKPAAFILSKLFHFVGYLITELKQQRAENTNNFTEALYNTSFVILVNMLLIGVGMLAHMLSNSLRTNGYHKTAKCMDTSASLLTVSLFAMHASKQQPKAVIGSLITGKLVHDATVRVGHQILGRVA